MCVVYQKGNTALTLARYGGHAEVVELLIKAGAKVAERESVCVCADLHPVSWVSEWVSEWVSDMIEFIMPSTVIGQQGNCARKNLLVVFAAPTESPVTNPNPAQVIRITLTPTHCDCLMLMLISFVSGWGTRGEYRWLGHCWWSCGRERQHLDPEITHLSLVLSHHSFSNLFFSYVLIGFVFVGKETRIGH